MNTTTANPIQKTVKQNLSEIDHTWRGLYLTSGILLIVIPILSFVAAYSGRILYASGYPGDPAAYLQLVSQHQALASLAWSLWIVMDFLGLAPTVALYLLLERHNRTLALLGSLISIFYAIYDVSVTELNSLTLVSLGHGYLGATSETLKASIVAAATYGYHALPIQTVLSFAVGSVANILWCVPMAKSFFGRWIALIGIIVNIIGLLGSAAPVLPSSYFLGLCQFLCVRLIALWSIVIGVQLIRYERHLPADMGNTLSVSSEGEWSA
jgi:hypothetical protein